MSYKNTYAVYYWESLCYKVIIKILNFDDFSITIKEYIIYFTRVIARKIFSLIYIIEVIFNIYLFSKMF